MKNKLSQSLLYTFFTLAFASAVSAEQAQEEHRLNACEQTNTMTSSITENGKCKSHIESYTDESVVEKKSAMKQMRLDEQLNSLLENTIGASNIEPSELVSFTSTPLTLTSPPIYAEICSLREHEIEEHVVKLVDDLGYTGSERKNHLASINNMLKRKNIC